MATTNQIYVLINGATSVLGRAFANLFAEDGYCLFLVDERPDLLLGMQTEIKEKFPMITVTSLPKDLKNPAAVEELYSEIQGTGKKVSVLVNYSEAYEYGPFVDTDWSKELAVIQTHIIATAQLTKLYLKEMLARNEGKILQVTSMLSFVPAPRVAIYGAARKFSLFFAEALQQEIKDTDVTLTILCPVDYDHQFFKNVSADQRAQKNSEADVARRGYEALKKGKKIEIVGEIENLPNDLHNIVPDSWAAPAFSKLLEESEKEEKGKLDRS